MRRKKLPPWQVRKSRTDTRTGEFKDYHNTQGQCGAIDQNAFPGGAAQPARVGAAAAGCRPGPNTLCLQKGRFQVTADFCGGLEANAF